MGFAFSSDVTVFVALMLKALSFRLSYTDLGDLFLFLSLNYIVSRMAAKLDLSL